MLFNIPQFIDKEDKIVGPLTAKQLGWLGAAGAVMLILWTMLDFGAVILAAIPVVGIFGAFAFYHPNGQPLISLISSSITFFFHPKAYIWRRVAEKDAIKKKAAKIDVVKVQKVVTEDKLEEISKLLDRR
jgi:hypothetical protein